MARPRNDHVKTKLEVTFSPTLVEYLDEIVAMEGYGGSRAEVIRNFVWAAVNTLIAARRLKEHETRAAVDRQPQRKL